MNNQDNTGKIIYNHKMIILTGLTFKNTSQSIKDNMHIVGTLECNDLDINRDVIVGAYSVRDNDILQLAANTFTMKDNSHEFHLEFNDANVDYYCLYADFIGEKNDEEYHKSDFSLDGRLNESFDIDYKSFDNNEITLDNIAIKIINNNPTLYLEVSAKYNYNGLTAVIVKLFDRNNMLLAKEFISLSKGNTHFGLERRIYNINPAEIERIKVRAVDIRD